MLNSFIVSCLGTELQSPSSTTQGEIHPSTRRLSSLRPHTGESESPVGIAGPVQRQGMSRDVNGDLRSPESQASLARVKRLMHLVTCLTKLFVSKLFTKLRSQVSVRLSNAGIIVDNLVMGITIQLDAVKKECEK